MAQKKAGTRTKQTLPRAVSGPASDKKKPVPWSGCQSGDISESRFTSYGLRSNLVGKY